MTEGECKPQIDYPCPWVYKVIGRNLAGLHGAIAEVLGECRHTVTPSRASKSGVYHSLNVSLTVESEAARIAFYESLRRHPAVVTVL